MPFSQDKKLENERLAIETKKAENPHRLLCTVPSPIFDNAGNITMSFV
jgi:hypothetical protein